MSGQREWDDYFMPGHPDVLDNLPGITNLYVLHDFEQAKTLARHAQLVSGEVTIPATFDPDHLKALHQHLFEQVYPWSGEFRSCNLMKARPEHLWSDPNTPEFSTFLDHTILDATATDITAYVRNIEWDFMTQNQVANHLAGIHAQLDLAHFFREGNGRVTRLFIDDVAKHAGYELTGPQPSRATYIDAVIKSHELDFTPLAQLFEARLTRLEPTAAQAGPGASISQRIENLRAYQADPTPIGYQAFNQQPYHGPQLGR